MDDYGNALPYRSQFLSLRSMGPYGHFGSAPVTIGHGDHIEISRHLIQYLLEVL